MSQSDAYEYNRTCDVCWRRLTTTDDMCETCEDHISGKIQEDNEENNMNDNNTTPTTNDAELRRMVTQLQQTNADLARNHEEYRHDVRANIGRIEEVLHAHARDCDDQALIDSLIDQINQATRNGFPELDNCTREYELTITYVVTVQASSEEDARDSFIDGDYDHLIELSDYYELDVEEGC